MLVRELVHQHTFKHKRAAKTYVVISNGFDHTGKHSSEHGDNGIRLKDGGSPLSRVGNTKPRTFIKNVRIGVGTARIGWNLEKFVTVVPHVGGSQNGPENPSKGNGKDYRKECKDRNSCNLVRFQESGGGIARRKM